MSMQIFSFKALLFGSNSDYRNGITLSVICLFRQKCSMKLENVQQDGSDIKDVPKSSDLEIQDLNHFC